MAYVVSFGSVLELSIIGRVQGQQTINTFHYWVRGNLDILDGRAAVVQALQQFESVIYEPLLPLISQDWTCTSLKGQWIRQSRRPPVFSVPLNPGGNRPSPSLPSCTSAVLQRRCDLSGRKYQGRIFMPGLAQNAVSGGSLTTAFMGEARGYANTKFKVELTVEGAITLSPVVLGTGLPDANKVITSGNVNAEVRVQRRREVGVGS